MFLLLLLSSNIPDLIKQFRFELKRKHVERKKKAMKQNNATAYICTRSTILATIQTKHCKQNENRCWYSDFDAIIYHKNGGISSSFCIVCPLPLNIIKRHIRFVVFFRLFCARFLAIDVFAFTARIGYIFFFLSFYRCLSPLHGFYRSRLN